MKKTIIGFIIAGIVIILAAWLVMHSCGSDKGDETDGPGYVPLDLTYETDGKLGESGKPETDVPEGSDETQPWGQPDTNDPNINDPDANDPETSAPETKAPETKAPETDPAEITPPDTTPVDTSKPETDAPETDDWFEDWGTETPVTETDPPETEAPETDAPYYPDYAPAPMYVNYVMMDGNSFRNFVAAPEADITEGGYNSYNMLPDGTFYMRQITNAGFERYVGEYRGGDMDLSLDIISYILSGDMQDMLIENEVNDTILEMCAVTRADSYTKQTVIWIQTKDGDFFITPEGEGEYKLYSQEDYLKLVD